MLNRIWFVLIVTAAGFAISLGKPQLILDTAMRSAQSAVVYALELAGIMTFWLGVLNIAQKSGLVEKISKFLRPGLMFLFPDIPGDHAAMGAILMNVSANVLGMGSAATPFGLSAMKGLQELNTNPRQASGAMCTLLALNTSGLVLIPVTLISARSMAGAANPGNVLPAAIMTSLTGSLAALILDRMFRRLEDGKRGR